MARLVTRIALFSVAMSSVMMGTTVSGCGGTGSAQQAGASRAATEGAGVESPAVPADRHDRQPSTGGGRSGARAELGALPAELSALRWPAAPEVAQTIEASATDVLRRAVDTPRTSARVHGRLGSIVVHASDVEIAGADRDAYVERIAIDPGVRRVRVRDLAVGSIELSPPARWDEGEPRYDAALMIEDVSLERLRVDASDSAFVLRGRRVAVIGCEARAERYALWAGDTGPLDAEDLIVVGNRFRSAGPESTLRMHDVVRSAVVGNTLENGAKHNYRVHGRSDLAYAARNVLVRTGVMIGNQPGDRVGTVFFEGNTLYHDVPSLFEIEPSAIRRLVCRDNVVYTDRWDRLYAYERAGEGWVIERNRRLPYRAYR